MSRPAEWSKRAQQKREFPEPEWLDALEDEDEQGPEVLPELSTPWPMPKTNQPKEQQS